MEGARLKLPGHPKVIEHPKDTERPKDIERPKRPLSAYMLFLNENRAQLKKENPNCKVTDIAKIGGELWRGLADKSKWEAQAIEMKEKYNEKVKQYEANGGTDTGAGKKRKSKGAKPVKKAKKKLASEEDEESD